MQALLSPLAANGGPVWIAPHGRCNSPFRMHAKVARILGIIKANAQAPEVSWKSQDSFTLKVDVIVPSDLSSRDIIAATRKGLVDKIGRAISADGWTRPRGIFYSFARSATAPPTDESPRH